MKKLLTTLRGAAVSRGSRSAYVTAAVIAVAIIFNVVIYSLTLLLGLFIYAPETDDLTLTGDTDAMFADAIERGKEVTITFCNTEDVLKKHDTGGFVYATALFLKEKYPDFINIKYVNIITGRDENGERYPLSKYTKDMKGNETPLLSNSVIFTSGQSWRVITDRATTVGYSDFYSLDSQGNAFAFNGEEVLTSMMAWVLNDEHKTVYFTQGHGETADVSFSNMLACAGYYVDLVNLRKGEIPADAHMLVISNPISDFEKGGEGVRTELERLSDYVKGGGRLFVTLDPYTRELAQLQGFLTEMGITISDSVSEGGIYSRDLIKDSSSAISVDGLSFVAEFGGGELAKKIEGTVKAHGTGSVLLSNVSRLQLSDNAEGLLYSSDTAVTMNAGKVSDSAGSYAAAAIATIENRDGEDGRVFVIPSMFLSSGDVLVAEGYSNKDFIYSLLSESMGATNAPYGCNSVVYNTNTLENLTMGAARTYTAVLILIPALLAVSGAVVIIRRKNR